VRAGFTTETITVYQAYPAEIALPAVAAGRFVPPFKRDRMTWIKPSFRWMMYRCGWGTKPGQEHVLAVEITRDEGNGLGSGAGGEIHCRREGDLRGGVARERQQEGGGEEGRCSARHGHGHSPEC